MTEELLDPESIDGAFVPAPRRDLAMVEVDNEIVLAVPVDADDEPPGAFDTHWLDRTASVAWHCFDGTISIDELADELEGVFLGAQEEIRGDLVELARTFGRSGLLQGVRPNPRPKRPEPVQPSEVPVGTLVDFEELTHLSGRTIDPDAAERRLLIKWSPGCGYCRQITADLAELAPELTAASVLIVLVASGSTEDNLAVLSEAGLTDVALVAGRLSVFEGLGTPSAYLVGDDRRTASPLVMGAPYVVELAQSATGSVDHG